MKTPWEFLQYSRNKIKNTWKIAFVSAFVIGLLIHLPVMLSDIPNHDGLSSMYFDQNMITSGRWLFCPASYNEFVLFCNTEKMEETLKEQYL